MSVSSLTISSCLSPVCPCLYLSREKRKQQTRNRVELAQCPSVEPRGHRWEDLKHSSGWTADSNLQCKGPETEPDHSFLKHHWFLLTYISQMLSPSSPERCPHTRRTAWLFQYSFTPDYVTGYLHHFGGLKLWPLCESPGHIAKTV